MAIPCQQPCQRLSHTLTARLEQHRRSAKMSGIVPHRRPRPAFSLSRLEPSLYSANALLLICESHRLYPYALPPHPRAILNAIPVVLHIRICDARLPAGGGREGRAGGAAGEGAEGGPGGLLAGLDRPQPRRVLLRLRRVTRPVRRHRRHRGRPRRDRFSRAGACHVPGPRPCYGGSPLRAAVARQPALQAGGRAGGTRRVKVETVERLCRKVLGLDPRELYGESFERAWQHRGKRASARPPDRAQPADATGSRRAG